MPCQTSSCSACACCFVRHFAGYFLPTCAFPVACSHIILVCREKESMTHARVGMHLVSHLARMIIWRLQIYPQERMQGRMDSPWFGVPRLKGITLASRHCCLALIQSCTLCRAGFHRNGLPWAPRVDLPPHPPRNLVILREFRVVPVLLDSKPIFCSRANPRSQGSSWNPMFTLTLSFRDEEGGEIHPPPLGTNSFVPWRRPAVQIRLQQKSLPKVWPRGGRWIATPA